MRRLVRRLKGLLRRRAKLCAATILIVGAALSGTSSSIVPAGVAADSVSFSAAEADSILALVEWQDRQIQLLKIDLWEARQLARVDSIYAEDRARLLTEYYEGLVRERRNWFTRTLQHPIIWLTIGGYLGVRAASEAR